MDTDDDLTDDHRRLLEWLDASLAAAQAPDMGVTNVEVLCADFGDAERVERGRMQ